MGEIELAYSLGYVRGIPTFNSIVKYMQKDSIAPWLHNLYKILAMPLADVEENFAADATGISVLKKRHWVDVKFNNEPRMDFKKLHVVTGVKTNIITSARITGGYRNDHTQYESMVRETSRNFRMREVCADPAYLSRKNCSITEEIGAMPFILPKSNTRTEFTINDVSNSMAWVRMVDMWKNNKDVFMKHYHQRSNVESTFSALKRKFLPYVRSKGDVAQYNEILCKVASHNVSVLCTAMFELGVHLKFGRSE